MKSQGAQTPYAALNRYLKERGIAANIADPSTILLTLDRSLSPAGDRKLQDTRIELGRWPNPGVLRLPKLAARILLQMEKRWGLDLVREVPGDLQKVIYLRKLHPEKSLRQLNALLKNFKHLKPSSVNLAAWGDILRAYEQGQSLEFKEWTQIILSYLNLRLLLEKEGFWLSDWQAVEAVLEHRKLLSQLEPADWTQILERDPRKSAQLQFLVLGSRDAYALERAFLEELRPLKSPKFLECEIPEAASDVAVPVLNPGTVSTARESALFWAFSDAQPSEVEVCEWIPAGAPLDLASENKEPFCRELHEIYLFANYRRLGKPSKHAWLFAHVPWKTPEHFTEAEVWERVKKIWERRDSHPFPLSLKNPSFAEIEEWTGLFLELGLLRKARSTPQHTRIHAHGVPFLSIHDLAFLPQNRKILWGTPASLEELTDPYKTHARELSLMPAALEDCFEAEGITLPKPAREMKKLRALLKLLEPELCYLQLEPQNKRLEERVPVVLDPYAKPTYSPTALQGYLNCGLRFYFDRVLGLKETLVNDPEKLPETLKGYWIHKVLERFLPQTLFKDTESVLFQEFEKSLDEVFATGTSPAYRRLLLQQARIYSKTLSRHVEGFEALLHTFYPQRTLVTESPVESTYLQSPFRGIVDRMDQLPNGEILLWDYKTGDNNNLMKTLVDRNKFQWYLYKRLLESAPPHAKVIGGGYLNPLAPEKSHIVYLTGTSFERFAEAAKGFGHKFEELEIADTQDIEALLEEKVTQSIAGLKAGRYTPLPHKESECRYCSYQGICGRPYLRETEEVLHP